MRKSKKKQKEKNKYSVILSFHVSSANIINSSLRQICLFFLFFFKSRTSFFFLMKEFIIITSLYVLQDKLQNDKCRKMS